MSTDNSSKPLDQPTSVSTPPEHVTVEQVIEPVGSKPWDTPSPVAAEPDQQRSVGGESSRERSLLEKGACVVAGGLTVVINTFGPDLQNNFGADGRTLAPIHARENLGPASRPSADVREIDQPPPNVNETREPEMKGTDQPHTPEEKTDQPHIPKAQPKRDHFDRPKNAPKPTYDKIRDNRPTPHRWGQGHH